MKRCFLLTLALLFIAAVRISAQDVIEFPDINTITPENIFSAVYDPLYSALVVVFGYVSAWIPGVKRFSPYARVLAFGLATGLGFHLFGGASIWKIALSFLISTGLIYDGFLKPFIGLFLKKAASTGK